jgi:hypothetical protein
VRSGSEAKNQNPGCGVTKSRHRLAPIFTIPISPAFLASNLFAIFHQPRTAGTDHELCVKLDQPTAIPGINSHDSTLQGALEIRIVGGGVASYAFTDKSSACVK